MGLLLFAWLCEALTPLKVGPRLRGLIPHIRNRVAPPEQAGVDVDKTDLSLVEPPREPRSRPLKLAAAAAAIVRSGTEKAPMQLLSNALQRARGHAAEGPQERAVDDDATLAHLTLGDLADPVAEGNGTELVEALEDPRSRPLALAAAAILRSTIEKANARQPMQLLSNASAAISAKQPMRLLSNASAAIMRTGNKKAQQLSNASAAILRSGSEKARPKQPMRLLSNAFRDIPPASMSLVAVCTVLEATSAQVPGLLLPLVMLSQLETGFQMARKAQWAWTEKEAKPPPLPWNETYTSFWGRVLDATAKVEDFVSDWFPEGSLDELSRSDVEDWIARNTFGTPLEETDEWERTQVVQMREQTEEALNRTFAVGPAGISSLAPSTDPVAARQHPLLMYVLLIIQRRRHAGKLKECGFDRVDGTGSLRYWTRRGDPNLTPVVFVHGIGVGLFPYHSFIQDLSARDNRTVILLELPSISTTLVAAPLADGAQLAREVRTVLDDQGYDKCAFVAHSFGSALAAFVAKYEPSLISGLVLVEPVCFLLNLAKSTKRVLYDHAKDPILNLVATDPTNALSLRRRFWWHEAILLAEDLRGSLSAPSTVFLADKDQIVPSADVAEYLAPFCNDDLPLAVKHFHDAPHGSWQTTPDNVKQVVDAAIRATEVLQAAPAVATVDKPAPPKRRRRGLVEWPSRRMQLFQCHQKRSRRNALRRAEANEGRSSD